MDRRKFIQVAGVSTTLMSGTSLMAICKNSTRCTNEENLKAWALAAFGRFE